MAVVPLNLEVPTSSNASTSGRNHHHNQRQGECHTESITFGEKGSETGQFNLPFGATVSDEGEIFIADCWNQRIQVFTLQGMFVRQFTTSKQNLVPHDVAVDGEGNLWVVGRSGLTELAVQYHKHGNELRKIDLGNSGWWRGVAVDTRRNCILITQTTTGDRGSPHGKVLLFRADGTCIQAVDRRQMLENPIYIAVDTKGNILVSDCEKHCVFVYSEDRQFQFKFGDEGSGEGQLCLPCGICTDRAGNIIVADSGNKCVEMFDKTGKFLKHVTTDKRGPRAVAMATQGQLIVTFWNHTVSILQNY
ncbi:PREDICTED: tripartite motif-containing protein 3-like [Branchiostoma belcheri]|uniref:Tripartite motif-containing protein 3-like n=1 Tax=Branchiostoma belcheri TaxID=7741 RepID=A0A6P5AK35_BRABE|nr:PREDICTED: tripartite motif-containing protein 3-like [Branchiostoma belcheri]